ncbi:class A beta-lactamase [Novosphingobium mangrovi (ex Huang et al. 2023)]|uniref:beta-lactamase n=1 Tax=Novosphingobium mangrovi (ex Huang et al. 2023) TaxID=2976432 RepID=A0ABT2I8M4_9SPHN|nr:class A beta-lactamase [Novosphingobium mangrovi (ex Huang et al. 2023)]MCT2401163.1 class A beta-lactamase [Novosphingobium mangrovi (ex Huang et al. 2023)]
MFDRRDVLTGAMAVLISGCIRSGPEPFGKTGADALRQIEARARGRLGAYVFDPARNQGFGWRERERFAHCSSFKLSLAAMVLAKAERGEIIPEEVLHWSQADLLSHSPVTSENVAGGLSVKDLAHATVVTSDNTAANVLLQRFGGPGELTRFWRSLGDTVSRLDRYEPGLNVVPAGSTLDTTTPIAMAVTVAKLLTGEHLSLEGSATLKQWMVEAKTGRDRIRAGFPPQWVAGDKTGTGIGSNRHTYVDLAFGGPPEGPVFVVAAYFEPEHLVEPMDPVSLAVLADVGRVAASMTQSECDTGSACTERSDITLAQLSVGSLPKDLAAIGMGRPSHAI